MDTIPEVLIPEVLKGLEDELSRLRTSQEKVLAIVSLLHRFTPESAGTAELSASRDNFAGNEASNEALFQGIDKLAHIHNIRDEFAKIMLDQSRRTASAYDLSKRRDHAMWGLQACPLLLEGMPKEALADASERSDWKPAWIVEGRQPEFISSSSSNNRSVHYETNANPLESMNLWGNMPAIDVLNIRHNEQKVSEDMAIAFIASGDLRDVVRTINEMPHDYPGELTVVLNDVNPMVVARNLALLLVLGMAENKRQAADIAVHLWYSAFLPHMYQLQLQLIIRDILESVDADGSLKCDLSPKSRIEGRPGRGTVGVLISCLLSQPLYQVGDAQNELARARLLHARGDRLHREYWPLDPSHRLAFHEFRVYGLLLPFGAANAHLNTPNRLLFSPSGRWLQADKVNPLSGWHLPSVIKVGKKHGALPLDIYGCMYFYVSDQLREFASRISSLRIKFQLFNMDACELATELSSGALSRYGLSADTRFDRIDASNLMDPHYLGVAPVLNSWGSLLKQNSHATLLAHFINWVSAQPKGVPGMLDIPRIIMECRADKLIPEPPPRCTREVLDEYTMMASICYTQAFNARYENSKAFKEYLDSQNLPSVLRTSGLRVKRKHTIVPHRLEGSLKSPSALPSFPDAQSIYLHIAVSDNTWAERYMELGRV
ncbi:uncharacterized protein FIBRA_00315 [Fibroporia radiculosa]|uniref:DUF4470 domain-containing protein n=1 Tax=Fibroporia radiculosa TaxID=599839 RepID=J7SC09_9APHY|nr:uncharacterized protein FIBRA_00315 [Fibroporia radiculosa]CCL98321.1 predicted protein [Fibroporia radiculosa]